MTPKDSISACIPCFNASRTLRCAAAGIRAQSTAPLELLIIDDSSTDDSYTIAGALADRVIRFSRNMGRGAVRNRAIREITSEYVLFCDASLAIDPRFVERALNCVQSDQVAAVFGIVSHPEASSIFDRWRNRHLFKAARKHHVDRRASLQTGGVLLKRDAVIEVGNFNIELAAGEDQELGTRLLNAGYEVVCDPNLQMTPLKSEALGDLLNRYVRWNCAPGHIPSWREYLRLARYSFAMAAEDFRSHDPLSAPLSLFSPHYLFWTRRILKPIPPILRSTTPEFVKAT